jgi:hypothetical protein
VFDRQLLCFAHGRDGDWEAICLDLDIAVQGKSFDDVRSALDFAIHDYIEAARNEAPAVRERLLARQAPLWVKAKNIFGFIWHALRHRSSGDGRAEHSFIMPCHA